MSLITLDIEIFQLFKDNIGYYFYLDERILNYIVRKTSNGESWYSHDDVNMKDMLLVSGVLIRLMTYWIWIQVVINNIRYLGEMISIIIN